MPFFHLSPFPDNVGTRCCSAPSPCSVQEAEQEEVKVAADTQPPRSAKKGKGSAGSTPQTGSDKKERKGKHKGQPADTETNELSGTEQQAERLGDNNTNCIISSKNRESERRACWSLRTCIDFCL